MFVSDLKQMGNTDVVEHEIETGDHEPIKHHLRRIPIVQRPILEEYIETLTESGQIEPSTSPWGFPTLLVKKKDRSWRLVIDYRKLNTITKSNAYPLPRLDDTLEALSGALYFCSLDLIAGFHQVKMSLGSKEKTAFLSHLGLYHWNVMPMGLKNAPATFQRCMELVLRGLTPNQCLVYLDDIIVF
ncbi:MAG: RNA-directed DNA polymerase, partial [Planctomycetes bacterium]|nr:RNA-directed DNA polymerase [Planctomycetota bacterium]